WASSFSFPAGEMPSLANTFISCLFGFYTLADGVLRSPVPFLEAFEFLPTQMMEGRVSNRSF
ncbi:MAG: hypothetical protein RI565_06585, partial [Schleiferiaceae bacterium]|nr:hypothetical protein [Schleiferiaceae bacterium]